MASSIVSITKKNGRICVKFKNVKDRLWMLKQLEKKEERERHPPPQRKKRAPIPSRIGVSGKDYFLTPEGHRVSRLDHSDRAYANVQHERNVRAAHEHDSKPMKDALKAASEGRKNDKVSLAIRKEDRKEEAARIKANLDVQKDRRAEENLLLKKEKDRRAFEKHEREKGKDALAELHRIDAQIAEKKAQHDRLNSALTSDKHKKDPYAPHHGRKADEEAHGAERKEGRGEDKTTYDEQLNKILAPVRGYQGCFASDEIHKVNVSGNEDTSFVLNSDSHDKGGTHWVAVWISPKKDKSVELFDSLADESPLNVKKVVAELKKKVEALNLGYRLKFKHNSVRDQRANSSSCGWFASHFILDRARGKSFVEASGFGGGSISGAEKALIPLEKRFKYI
jgi:hypothetical protein